MTMYWTAIAIIFTLALLVIMAFFGIKAAWALGVMACSVGLIFVISILSDVDHL